MIDKRRATKTMSWRILATLTTVVVTFAVTGNISTATDVGFLDAVLKLALYYWHEKQWEG